MEEKRPDNSTMAPQKRTGIKGKSGTESGAEAKTTANSGPATKKKNIGSAVEAVVFGVVQGVGFRPFVYRLAKEFGYFGWVKNVGFGVAIHLEKRSEPEFRDFFDAFDKQKPPLAQVDDIRISPAKFLDCDDFQIKKSQEGGSFVFISPDISLCENCLKEMRNPSDRRYGYPFINCTDCGPRYTIVRALPYDRKMTTMDSFIMCENCRREYENPLDRRYHAQPVACPVCGPEITLINAKTHRKITGGVPKAAALIRKGKILAVKGLGGFHLVCNPFDSEAVKRLRRIKERKTKPLALMGKDLDTVKKYAWVDRDEEGQLLSARRPIVLLRKKRDIRGIAPHLDEMGFMLPYTPLHYLLLEEIPLIVATSSNKKDSPIMKDVEEGIDRLCDYILNHNRPIAMRADDSVMKVVDGEPLFVRRARGYVPYPQQVPKELESPLHILALGGELKDTISIYKNGYVITSQFLGDLDEYENFRYFEETIEHLVRLFELKPEAIVSDLHPDFHTTRYARKSGLRHIQVQHHFAHVLAPLLEHGVSPQKRVLGVAFDGYGYGNDGTAWGAEFLLADYKNYERAAHFKYIPLPGGDAAAKQPWRMALSYLIDTFGRNYPSVKSMAKVGQRRIRGVTEMIRQGINSPPVSSCGRLFDAVSFLSGIAPSEMEFEAEAPMRLESAAASGIRKSYPFSVEENPGGPLQISFSPTIRSVLKDLDREIPVSHISAKFHNTLARLILGMAERMRREHDIDTVVLIGGVFLNKRLLERATRLLQGKGFRVLRPIRYSPNDESISVGQIAHALRIL
ncbi:MAG: carbamoyltransferase HypF [Candidatus Aminicenantes bacterium]|nr:carbamoyltransferase HypF [Candidatus Aminicenantes bacterium]